MKKILLDNKEYQVESVFETDFCIVGGGTAGIAASISAIDMNLSFIVVEKNISLSGTMSSALVSPMMPTKTKPTKTRKRIIELQQEIEKSELTNKTNKTTIWYDGDLLTSSIESKISEYEKGEILFNASITEVIIEDEEIKYIIVNSFNNLIAIKAKTFLDSTGDAFLSKLSGVKTVSGDDNGINQAITLRHEVANIDMKKLMDYLRSVDYTFNPLDQEQYVEFVYVPEIDAIGRLSDVIEKGVSEGKISKVESRYIQGFAIPSKPGAMTFNSPQLENIYRTNDSLGLSKHVIEGKRMIYNIHSFLKENIPGFENSYVAKIANMLGIRESNRIVGQYVLDESDYANRSKFDDGVARGDWYIDIHSDDLEVESKEFKDKYDDGEYYEIPYRSLITNEIRNLIVAGRSISTTFIMQSSVRIQQTVFDMGAAAAIGSRISIDEGIDINKVDGKKVKEINYE